MKRTTDSTQSASAINISSVRGDGELETGFVEASASGPERGNIDRDEAASSALASTLQQSATLETSDEEE